MNTVPNPQLDLLPNDTTLPDNDLHMQIWGLLSTLYPQQEIAEQRHETRYPFPYLVHLTPVNAGGAALPGETLVVIGKHLSQRGLGFYHPKPLPYRRMIASLESNGQWLGFLIDLKWCRFTHQGWYESGGRILESALSPMEQGYVPVEN
jgi:hypothetical protein